MDKSCNILLVSNDPSIESELNPKIILLREVDSLYAVSYAEAYNDIGKPDIIMVYCNDDKFQQNECLDLIKHLRNNENLYATSIILVVEKFDKGFLLNAYDENITDFVLKDAEQSTFLVKLMWAFRKNALIKELRKRKEFLSDFGVVDKKTGFYVSQYREKIFNHELNYIDTKKTINSILLIGASDKYKSNFNYDDVCEAIKNSVRASDIIFQGPNEKIYVLLPNTPLNKACHIFEAISIKLTKQKSIIAAITNINGKSFEIIEDKLLANISKAEMFEERYIILNDNTNEYEEVGDESWQHWFKQNLGTPKNFKIFKAAYNKKLKNVIVPTFFQLQKIYEEKLFEVTIGQETGETTSKFTLKKGDAESELQINYNGFSKIHVNIVNKGLDSPENQNYEIDLAQISEKNITTLVENFIKTFVENNK